MPQMEEITKKTGEGARKGGILWQAQAERRWLASMLAY